MIKVNDKNIRQPAILTDVTKCIGCAQCVVACKETYNLESDVPRRWHKEDGLSAENWTSILRKTAETKQSYIRKQCRHCFDPACSSACPAGALYKSPEGAVIYDRSKCIGCRYCMMACPYGIPRYEWDEPVPYVKKCILCYPRLLEDKQPACTEACPTGATIFGDWDDLVKEAHSRIKSDPERYIHQVWGEKEIGGTAVLYISDIDLSFLSYGKELGTRPVPKATETAMVSVLPAFFGMGAIMTGLHLFTERKNRIAQEKKNKERRDDEQGS